MRVLANGERAWLLEMADSAAVRSMDAALRLLRSEGGLPWMRIVDIVPAARTVLVTASNPMDAAALRQPLAQLTGLAPQAAPVGGTVEIPVTYDGPDLAAVAQACGLTPAEVVASHTSTPWAVAFGGFAPGFAYLSDGDPRLRVARRSEPRTAVPQGAVALADGYSAIYPRRSPGGWQLIGHTDVSLWDASREQPALLLPGMLVQFRALP